MMRRAAPRYVYTMNKISPFCSTDCPNARLRIIGAIIDFFEDRAVEDQGREAKSNLRARTFFSLFASSHSNSTGFLYA